jgi:hypothetical protein
MPPFLLEWDFWEDLTKMALQFAGASGIAALTVRWALSRYKAEKLWERETAAYLSVLEAINELDEVNWRWLRGMASDIPEDLEGKLRERWAAAKQRVDAVAAAASVVLPPSADEAVGRLTSDLQRRYDDYYEDLKETGDALDRARTAIVAVAKRRVR